MRAIRMAPLLVDAGFYLRPEERHWITATVPDEDGPCDANDFEPDLHLFEDVIWPQLYARAPGFDAVKVVRHWVGHYAYNTLDQNAILGPHPDAAEPVSDERVFRPRVAAIARRRARRGRTSADRGWQSLDLSDLSVARVLENRPFREQAIV